MITLENVDRLQKNFHCQISEKIFLHKYHKDSPPHVKYVSTLRL